MGLKVGGIVWLCLKSVKVLVDNCLVVEYFDYWVFFDYVVLVWCVLVLGIGEVVLDYVIVYCNECEVFGELISYC